MASTELKTDQEMPSKRPIPPSDESSAEIAAMLLPSLYRLTDGLPRKELNTIISEAMLCEEALENDIRELQEALDGPSSNSASVQLLLDSELTPPDRYFTVSSLLGRLRDELATPLPPNSTLPELRAEAGLIPPPPKKKKKESHTISAEPSADSVGTTLTPSVKTSPICSTTLDKQKKLLALYKDPEYTKEHPQPNTIMSLWKRISSHRTSIVFRRPVNPKEAPGYTDRISFPMDLSLIRKMIVARQIKSYSDLHQRLGMICHNCVKYNGRESDYGVVTRDFESNADEMVLAAVLAAGHETRNPRPKTPPPPTLAVTELSSQSTAAAAAGGGEEGKLKDPLVTSSPGTTATTGSNDAAATATKSASPAESATTLEDTTAHLADDQAIPKETAERPTIVGEPKGEVILPAPASGRKPQSTALTTLTGP